MSAPPVRRPTADSAAGGTLFDRLCRVVETIVMKAERSNERLDEIEARLSALDGLDAKWRTGR